MRNTCKVCKFWHWHQDAQAQKDSSWGWCTLDPRWVETEASHWCSHVTPKPFYPEDNIPGI